jgi:uncharacterized membrane protein YGL010W
MASLFRPAVDLLAQYAEYHRDLRNIQTHRLGVPMIVFGIGVLLSVPSVEWLGLSWTPAWALFALAAAWYLTRGHLGAGLAVTLMVGLIVALAHWVPTASTAGWLAWGAGFFFAGSAIQLIGHYYEGRQPTLSEVPEGLLVGPMFVALELLSLAGLLRGLAAEIERRAGPTHLRDLAHPA